jgi:signal transduction histidine kinase
MNMDQRCRCYNTAMIIAASLLILATLIVAGYFVWERIVKGLKENEVLKYEFITIIAHKFRTPLSGSKWALENLIKEEPDGFKKQTLQELQVANQKLIDLTGTLVELTDADSSAVTGYKFEDVPLCEVAKSLVASMKSRFHEKNQFVSVECPPEDVRVNIDRARMEFVIQTLLENANLYSPTGRNVKVGVVREGKKAVLYVQDDGIGIAPEDMPRIFSKFYRTEAAQRIDTEGFGIALYLANSIVARHNGTMAVTSAGKDKGSVFSLTLPLAS